MTAPTDLAGVAQRMIASGVPWREVAERIVHEADGNRELLQAAVLSRLGLMRRGRSDDFEATAVLRALERALASTPRDSASHSA